MPNERNQLLRKIELQLPEISKFLVEIGSTETKYPKDGEKKEIRQHVQDQLDDIVRNKRFPNDEKLLKFIFNCLYVQVKDEVANRTVEALEKRYKNYDIDRFVDVPSSELAEILKTNGYRFWSTKSVMLKKIAKHLKENFNGDLDNYLSHVKSNYENDSLLRKHLGVSYKSRDWALSQFSPDFSLVDVHVKNALRSSGLILYSYLYHIPLSTDRGTTEEYKHIRDLVRKLADSVSWKPFKLVQYLWFFGKEYCSKNACSKCKIKKCLSSNTALTNSNVSDGIQF